MNGPRVNAPTGARPITQPEAEELADSADDLLQRLSDEEMGNRARFTKATRDAMTRVEHALHAATGLTLSQRVERRQ